MMWQSIWGFLFGLLLVEGENWAVIVAGSRGYGNYRHQADVCRAYQIASNNGIIDDHIIMMYYDDIAHNKENPFPGKLFNQPTQKGDPGVDVYKGCKKDYIGDDVTPQNFIAVLTGDSVASGGMPVLKSTADDDVFVNFVDHGGAGIIAFPQHLLDAKVLNDALIKSHAKGLFKRMVFYLEACESGSMFEKILPANISVYATTASNASQPSWGTFCPPHDVVNGVQLNTCLGDLYSVNWMENAQKAGMRETLQNGFEVVKKETNKSTVMQYGNLSWTSEIIGDFIGNSTPTSDSRIFLPEGEDRQAPPVPTTSSIGDGGGDGGGGGVTEGEVESRLIPIHLAYWKYFRLEQSGDGGRGDGRVGLLAHARKKGAAARALIRTIAHQLRIDDIFLKLSLAVTDRNQQAAHHLLASPPHPHAFATVGSLRCIARLRRRLWVCGVDFVDPYTMRYHRVLANICQDGTTRHAMTIAVLANIRYIC